MRRGRLAALAVALAGCDDGSTLLTIEIQSALSIPDQLDRLCVQARPEDEAPIALGYDARGTELGDELLPGLPASIVFEDSRDLFDRVTVSVDATWRGRPAGSGLVRASLVDHDSRSLEVQVDECAGRTVSSIALERSAALPPTAAVERRALLLDLDGDGAAELVEAPVRVVRLSESTPEDVTGRMLEAPLGASFLAAGDLDHDCVADLVFTQPQRSFPPLVWGPEGAAAPRRGEDERVGWPEGAGGPLAIGDVDQTGAADVLVVAEGGVRLLVAHDPLDGRVEMVDTEGVVELDGEPDGEGRAAAMSDLDGDGRLDAVVGYAGAADPRHTVRLLHGTADSLDEVPGAFADPEGRDVAAVAVGRLDGEQTATGDVLVAFSGGGGPAAILWAVSPGVELPRFRRRTEPAIPEADGRDLAVVDLDGDCDLDVVLAIADAPSVVLEQTAEGLVDAGVELPPAIAVAAAVTTVGPGGERRPLVVLLDAEGGGSLWR